MTPLFRALPFIALVLSFALHAGVLGGLCWWTMGGNYTPAVPFAAGESAAIQVRWNAAPRRPRLELAPPTRPPIPDLAARLPALFTAPTSPERQPELSERATVVDEKPRLDPVEAEPEPPSLSRGGVRTSARALGEIQPVYPERCRRARHEGTCVLELSVAVSGVVTDVRLVESAGCEELDRSAADAMRRARFTPEMAGDGLLAAKLTQRVRFELKR